MFELQGKERHMKHSIHIYNFGPVGEAEIDLNKKLQVLIGEQASGKSTICKVVYFCQKIRDYTLEFLMDAEQYQNSHQNEYFNNYMKYLSRQFMGYFGKTTHMKRFRIVYLFGGNEIRITLNSDGYIRFVFDKNLKNGIYALINDAAKMHMTDSIKDLYSSTFDRVAAMIMFKKDFRIRLNHFFSNENDILYIPAGRSLLATMPESLQDMLISEMDLTMQDFIRVIRIMKSSFGDRIPDIVKEYTKTIKGQVNNDALDKAYRLIHQVLKADYISDSDDEKIYFDEKHWVKLMYGSSGQQEVLWILMLIFKIILESGKQFVIIEEPEAHLFPVAQKDVVELIALLVRTTGSQVIVTTHSPYVLTSLNVLLYSDKVENHGKGKKMGIIPANVRIDYGIFQAYRMNPADGSIVNLMDEETHMIQTDYIDSVSTITNEELEKLIEREVEDGEV